ncbi:fibrinogen-like YCDxxxxGGGW domain-containing protein [Sorangium sp. So ce1335]|uniref:fibrinogen-like YCDxxxxGGGW domain-containing protein n=1 Tax=Sorangium sp. So ce1335 TaxID=3133335 RepID=UPI003F631880
MRSGAATWVLVTTCLLACGCTTVAGLDRRYHLHPDDGAGGAGGSPPADARCDVEAGAGCVYDRCSAVPDGAPGGVYTIDPDGTGPQEPLQVHCGEPADGGRWALVYNSVGGRVDEEHGTTRAFWNIPYRARLSPKGKPSLDDNHYQPGLYSAGREYRDEIEDTDGKVAEVLFATAAGIDAEDMTLSSPELVTPKHVDEDGEDIDKIFANQFGAGWSSPDFDGDDMSDRNCAVAYGDVTQHYGSCFVYSLGADADEPTAGQSVDAAIADDDWGPHLDTEVAERFELSNDGTQYTRVKRISRWTRW